jgi:glycosyltransferase involved in cell wall biosynthesis
LKILWITTSDESTFGHTELFGLAKSLIKKGHKITVIAASKEKARKDGHLRYVKNPFKRLLLFKLKLALYLPWLIVTERPDFIILEWQSAFIPVLLFPLIKIRLYRNNLIHDVRTIPVKDFDVHEHRVFRLCLNISTKCYLGITTITEVLKQKICSEYHVPEEKVGVWSSGVDVELFYPRDGNAKKQALGLLGKFVVFYHGSVGYRRGVVETVKALGLLQHRYNDICLFILGSGMELKTVQKIIKNDKLENVHVQAPVNYTEVSSYIAIADVCIVPLADVECWRVSSPLKLLEYLAMGKPVILSDILAHRRVIKDDANALYVHDISPEGLSIAIEKAYIVRPKLEHIGHIGLQYVQQHCTWDIQADKLVAYLQNIKR